MPKQRTPTSKQQYSYKYTGLDGLATMQMVSSVDFLSVSILFILHVALLLKSRFRILLEHSSTEPKMLGESFRCLLNKV